MKVRSENGTGKLLFEWDPTENTIALVQKNMYYRVKLLSEETGSTYHVVEKRPKDKDVQQSISPNN